MSRIGKMPITIPSGVTVNIKEGNITVKGPKGELSRSLPAEMLVKVEGEKLTVARPSDSQKHMAYHGLTRTLVANMVQGVSKGFEKTLEIVGVGYRAEKSADKLTIRVGFSQPVEVKPAHGITLAVE